MNNHELSALWRSVDGSGQLPEPLRRHLMPLYEVHVDSEDCGADDYLAEATDARSAVLKVLEKQPGLVDITSIRISQRYGLRLLT